MTKLGTSLSCIVVLYISCTAYAKHAHRVLTFKSNMNEQDIIWKETLVTKIGCVAACFRDQNCLSVHFSPNGSCLGLKVKLEKEDATGGRGQTEHIYVMDRGMTSDIEASLRSLSTDPRRQTKGMTTNYNTSPTRQTTRPLQQTKKSEPCGPPPIYPNAVIKSTTGETTVYSCKLDYICCEKQMIRSCLPTGEWETGIVECIRTFWGGPFGSRRKRFKQDFPCGPTDDIAVVIGGMITGKSMKLSFLRNSDILFYMAYESTGYGRSVNTYSAKLNGNWKAMKQMSGIIPFGRNVRIKIYLFQGLYSVEVDNVIRHKLIEAEKGGMPTSILLQNDIEIFSVRFVINS